MPRNKMYMSSLCKDCMKRKYIFDTDDKEYLENVRNIIEKFSGDDAGVLELELIKEYNKHFEPIDYASIKNHFNKLLMEYEKELEIKIEKSDDPLLSAINMSIISNYIDFSAFKNVDEEKLINKLTKQVDSLYDNYNDLCDELSKCKNLIFITDNCGEIVLDKLLIKTIKKIYPSINVTAMVRGAEVVNDATLLDAKEIGLDEVCDVIDNGLKTAGTNISDMPKDKKNILTNADLIIAKGQANAETLSGSGLNIYYLLLCKCEHFSKIFNVEKLTPLMEKERID